MSIFKHIKRAFGLGDNFDSDDSDYEYEDEEGYQPVAPKPIPVIRQTPVAQRDESLSGDIFAGVIELFNQTQPEFVRECMDTEAQKEYILNNISSALKQRLENEVNAAKARGKMQWDEELRKLDKEVETLRQEKETLEQKREESKTEKLSAERQKRALIERVHDLENQVMTLEADKEQYMLENRSMANKLRVASVTSGGVSDDAVEEIVRLNDELTKVNSEKEALSLEAEHFKAIADAHTPVMDTLLSNITDLVNDIIDAKGEQDKLKKKIESLLSIQEYDVKEIADLKAAIKEKDAAIESLKKELEERPEPIPEPVPFDDEPFTFSTSSTEEVTEKENKRSKGKKTPRISAIDELLESTDWFVAPSLPEVQMEKDEKRDDDFGYKAPTPRKAHPDDDKQLSLW